MLAPRNAPGFISRVEGEKTLVTETLVGVQPDGGSCFAAAHAVTIAKEGQQCVGLDRRPERSKNSSEKYKISAR